MIATEPVPEQPARLPGPPTGDAPLVAASKRLRYRVGVWVGGCPSLYFALYKSAIGPGENLVCRETSLVLEGFPRSGNTFATAAFQLSQPAPLRLAHHTHSAAQVLRGVRVGKPVLAVVRPPEDAVASWLIREPHLTIPLAMKAYAAFYQRAVRVADGVVFAKFETVTSDFGRVGRALNDRFDASFGVFDHTEENVERCFANIDHFDGHQAGSRRFLESVPRPTEARKPRSKTIKEQIGALSRSTAVRRARAAYLTVLQQPYVV